MVSPASKGAGRCLPLLLNKLSVAEYFRTYGNEEEIRVFSPPSGFPQGGVARRQGMPVASGRHRAGGDEAVAVGREGIQHGIGFGVVVIGEDRLIVRNPRRRQGGRQRRVGRFSGGQGGRGQGRGQALQEGGIISVILGLATCREEDEVELILRIFAHKLRDK